MYELCALVTVSTLSAGISKLTTSSKPFHPHVHLHVPQIQDFADIVCVYKSH